MEGTRTSASRHTGPDRPTPTGYRSAPVRQVLHSSFQLRRSDGPLGCVGQDRRRRPDGPTDRFQPVRVGRDGRLQGHSAGKDAESRRGFGDGVPGLIIPDLDVMERRSLSAVPSNGRKPTRFDIAMSDSTTSVDASPAWRATARRMRVVVVPNPLGGHTSPDPVGSPISPPSFGLTGKSWSPVRRPPVEQETRRGTGSRNVGGHC